MTNPGNVNLSNEELRIREELGSTIKNEEIPWAHKARVNWLQLGDKNTMYFQTMTNVRKKRNEVTKIKDHLGNWWLKGEGLEQLLCRISNFDFVRLS